MMKTKKLIIFGNGVIAQLANYYFTIDSDYEVVGFTVDKAYIVGDVYEDKPGIPFEEIEEKFPKTGVEIFVALSYDKMNAVREQMYYRVKEKGYTIASYISSK
jgi:hypothetical protein